MLGVIGIICIVAAFGLAVWGDITIGIAAYNAYYVEHDNYYQGAFWFWVFINLIVIGGMCIARAAITEIPKGNSHE